MTAPASRPADVLDDDRRLVEAVLCRQRRHTPHPPALPRAHRQGYFLSAALPAGAALGLIVTPRLRSSST
ncbi:hypothetical protein, partial [Accumulibacter sp.]|uniref:hypothetical protein n=1 Tax=Accumulibacter sp. TaxID=2053492 RepID=UPI002622EB8E